MPARLRGLDQPYKLLIREHTPLVSAFRPRLGLDVVAPQVGQRVLEATVGDQPLDPERVYRVITIDYLATGGDGQEAFPEGTNVAYGDGEVWAVADYVRDHSPVDAKVEGRIVQR